MAPVTHRLKDDDAERIRRSHAGCILELQSVPVMGGTLVRNVELEDGISTPIAHGLGRRASLWPSAVRASGSATTGRIRDVTEIVVADASKVVVLKAEGWGETIKLDAWIF